MVTDKEISEALQCILKQKREQNLCSDEFVNGVVEELQSKLNVDLSGKVVFIRSQIQQQQQQQHEDDNFALLHTPNFHPLPSSSEQQPKADDNTPTENVVVSVPKESTQTKGKRRGGPGGLNKLCGVSPLLQTIVGQPALPRTEIVKQLWAYIRKHNLQDPSNKRKIICNDELRLVFETDCTDMFKMNKLLAKHIIPLEATKESAPKKVKVENESGTQSAESGPSVKISEALGNFFGVAEREMLQSEVLRRIWEYIKLNGLEDPANSMVIICDAKLQELFGCKNISALGIPQVLAQHHILSRS